LVQEVGVHITGLGRGLIACDRFNSLPQFPAVPVVLKMVLDFVSRGPFSQSDRFVQPCCSVSPDLKAESLDLSRAPISVVIHGFSFALTVMRLVAWTSSVHF